MEINMRVNFLKEKKMGLEFYTILKDLYMKESGNMIKPMGSKIMYFRGTMTY